MKKILIATIAALLIAALTASSLAGEYYVPDFVVCEGGSVYVRTAPDLNAPTLGTMHRGETAEFAWEFSEDYRGVTWFQIYWRGGLGWISSRYADLHVLP